MLHEAPTPDIFESTADAIVNPVNCVGVMGAGLAKQFAAKYPEMLAAYETACARRELRPGTLQIHDRGAGIQPRYIVNFPTKDHWRDPSKVEYIQSGLSALERFAQERQINRIAVPALGSGLGGLEWANVRSMIAQRFDTSPLRVDVYSPSRTRSNTNGQERTNSYVTLIGSSFQRGEASHLPEAQRQALQQRIERDSAILAQAGAVCRSGRAPGMDTWWEAGFPTAQREIYLAWDGSFGGRHGVDGAIVVNDQKARAWAHTFVQEHHPAPERLSRGGWALQERDVFQVVGADPLNPKPSAFTLAWAPRRTDSTVEGGTNTAIQASRAFDVPWFNYADPGHRRDIDDLIATVQQRGIDAAAQLAAERYETRLANELSHVNEDKRSNMNAQQSLGDQSPVPRTREPLIVAITGDLVLRDAQRQHLERVLAALHKSDALVRVGTSSGTEAFVREYAKTNGGPRLEIHPTFDNYQHNGVGTVVPVGKRDRELTERYLRAIDPSSAGRGMNGIEADSRHPYMILGEDLATPANLLIAIAKNKDMSVVGSARPAWELARRLSITSLNLGGSDRDVSFSLGKLLGEYPQIGWPSPPIGNRIAFGARIDERAQQAVDGLLEQGKAPDVGAARETPAITIEVHRIAQNLSDHVGAPVVYVGRFRPEAIRAIDDKAVHAGLGNPIPLGDNKSREERERVATRYLEEYERTPRFQRAAESLAQQAVAAGTLHLACHCHPDLCHAHVLGSKIADLIRERNPEARIETNFSQQQRIVQHLASPRIDLDAERLRAAVQTRFDLQGRNSVALENEQPQAGIVIERLGNFAAIEVADREPGTYQIVNVARHPQGENLRVNDHFEPSLSKTDGMELTVDREASA